MKTGLAKKLSAIVAAAAGVVALSVALAQGLDKRTVDDIQRHRIIAAAHENAARCLESGRNDAVCEGELQIACTGIAIGKYCGMKHEH